MITMKPRPKTLSLSPSSAHTWSVCTAQPRYVWDNWDKVPPQDSTYSQEGSLAHKVCECLLKGEPMPVGATTEMLEYAEDYVAFVEQALADLGPSMSFVELKVPLYYQIERNGIIDFAAVRHDGTALHIVDYKYGFTPVEAERNKQLSIYVRNLVLHVRGVVEVSKDAVVRMTIDQPRLGSRKTWETTLDELDDFLRENVEAQALSILYPEPKASFKFAPSDETCKFCPAESFCTARAQWIAKDFEPLDVVLRDPQSVIDDPEDIVGFAPPETLDEQHLAAALAIADAAKKWFSNLESYALARAVNGNPPPGFKAVEGRGSRQWGDDAEAERFLKARLKKDAYQPAKILSPAQAEKALKGKLTPRLAKKFDELITRKEGNPTLVRESDKRPALTMPEDQFSVLPSSED